MNPGFTAGRNLIAVPEEPSLMDSQAVEQIGSRRPNIQFDNRKQIMPKKNKDVKSTYIMPGRRDSSPLDISLEADSDTERVAERKNTGTEAFLTQSLYIDPRDTSHFDVSLVQKISTIMPHAIENSFVMYQRKSEHGLKVKVTEKLKNEIEESFKNENSVCYSDYMRYDG